MRLFVFASLVLSSSFAFAWGQRGHNMVCEVATKLVQNPKMQSFMLFRSESMGHICNIPDIYWRDLGPAAKSGDAAHFLNPENEGLTLQTVPDSIKDYYAHDKNPGEGKDAVHYRAGSLIWRAQQFYERAVKAGRDVNTAKFPQNRDEEQKDELPYNKASLNFLINLGLMGHFVGDASMPFHTTADYDGYDAGHGGIHGYYEGGCVSWLDFGIEQEIFVKALEMRKRNQLAILNPVPQPALTLTRAVAVTNSVDRAKILGLDQVREPSVAGKGGRSAKRDSFEVACPRYRDLIIQEIATSALALANLWDSAYAEAGNPNVSKYRSYQYPFTPDFVGVDYLP